MKILDHGLHGFLWVSFIRAIRVIRGQFLWWVRPGCAGLCVFAVLVLPVLGLLTWRQSGMYTDIETLWNTTLERNPNAAMPHYNLGLVLLQKGQKDEAMAHFQTAVQLEPDYTEARNNLGGLLLIQGRVDEAIAQFRQVIEAEPDHARAHYNLAKAFLQRGESEQAIAHFQKALEGHPNSTPDSGSPSSPSEPDAPGAAFEREFFAEVHEDLAQVLVQKGRVDDAIVHFKLALERRPDDATAYSALGALFEQKHQAGNAIGHYRMALKLQPQNADVLNNLAWIRAANAEAGFRDGPEAVDLAERACRLTDFRQPLMVGTLAAAYAEAGRFDDAVATAEKARALAIALGQQDVAAKNLELIRLFKARQPYREAF